MSLQFHFRNSTNPAPKLQKPSDWIPPLPKNTNVLKYFSSISLDIASSRIGQPPFTHNNLSLIHQEALVDLKKNENIVIKPADKGGSIVILNKDDYICKALEQLNNKTYYTELLHNPTQDINTNITSYVEYIRQRGYHCFSGQILNTSSAT